MTRLPVMKLLFKMGFFQCFFSVCHATVHLFPESLQNSPKQYNYEEYLQRLILTYLKHEKYQVN